MTNVTKSADICDVGATEDYRSSKGPRALLNRLHASGRGAWEHDPATAEFMAFTAV